MRHEGVIEFCGVALRRRGEAGGAPRTVAGSMDSQRVGDTSQDLESESTLMNSWTVSETTTQTRTEEQE